MPAVKLDVTSWNLPRDLQLADPGFNIPGDIDMLIGAEVYLDLLRDGFRKRNSSFPIMHNTALGWKKYIPTSATPPTNTTQSHLFCKHFNIGWTIEVLLGTRRDMHTNNDTSRT
jgi:hypothetical protein